MLNFVKYQGAGNDFVIINLMDKTADVSFSKDQIVQLCDRRFGIGADGLMLLKPHEEYDFFMDYYNSDGSGGMFCGNGGRCIVAFAKRTGVIENETTFLANDGIHQASIDAAGWVKLKMKDTDSIVPVLEGCYLNTGTDHYVQFVEDLENINVFEKGQFIRYHEALAPRGANANFVSGDTSQLVIATYERGVEDETLACGTGIVAAAIVAIKNANQMGDSIVPVKAKGGHMEVRLSYDGKVFTNIWLCGPGKFVFEGVCDF